MKLTIVAPTYNEAENLVQLVDEVGKALVGVDYELMIADDDSPDLTWARAEEIGKQNPRVRCLRRVENRGLGHAVIDGFTHAAGEVLACMDADLQHDPAILPQMLHELEAGSDLVVGSRYVSGGGTGEWNRLRRLESWLATKLAQVVLGVKLKDPMSGYFMLRRRDFESVCARLNGDGFKILLEIVARLKPRQVTEIPYIFRARTAGESKLSSRVVVAYLRQLWRLGPFRRGRAS